ncbi:lecithin retinol acyltransferase family protein [Frederiksenia canicola]|uniref:Lecithin:retinol acyltransferase n=1 Tax=Frederiksenia canicola TaxID=123824 RepID=A0AAE7C2E7_9PAST|nr:lecithin retinol acyltransferase family protein [Frederiksenia canicola]QIM64578.1 hypothetical protein A4G17_03540 [Frederiksenia canicola]RPE91000.1 lecithin:retinol acyltransferase [Frederiksenia canicola]
MIAGDHIYSPRTGYTHHGIYIGNQQVIHYSGFANGMNSGEICIAAVDEFSNGNPVHVLERPFRVFSHTETVERAYQRLGEDWYNVLLNNCEHFVNWCINGKHESSQVNDLVDSLQKVNDAVSYSKSLSSPSLDSGRIATTVPTSSLPLSLGGGVTAISGLAGIASTVVATKMVEEVLSDDSEVKQTFVDAVDSTTEFIGETVEEVGEVIDSVVTGAIDFIGSIFD